MLTERVQAEGELAAAASLLDLALDDGATAQRRARTLIAATADPWWSSVAHHTLGLVLRTAGDLPAAVEELRTALRLASRSGDTDRAADVRATLGVTLISQGHTKRGLRLLDAAIEQTHDRTLAAKALMRRGACLSWILGRHHAGLADLSAALRVFEEVDDQVWEARTRGFLGLMNLAVGDVAAAEALTTGAREQFLRLGRGAEAALILLNQGVVAYVKGDLPTALSVFDRCDDEFSAHDVDPTQLVTERSTALLAAGLAAEAVTVVDEQLQRGVSMPLERAELRLRLAKASLAIDAERATVEALAASRLFRRIGGEWFTHQADLVALLARERTGIVDRRLTRAAADVAAALEDERSDEAVIGWLLAARAAAVHDPVATSSHLARAARHRNHHAAVVRAGAWLARALDDRQRNNRRGVLVACGRGLAELDRHRATLGSSELRALASGHGSELAALALTTAADGPPRQLLRWSERWRATSLAQPPVRPTRDDELAGGLAALRDNERRLAVARSEVADTTQLAQLEREKSRLEDQVRRITRRTAGAGLAVDSRLDVDRLVTETGDAAFVELLEIAGELHAVVATRGRVRTRHVGLVAEAEQAADFARYCLRLAARGRAAPLGEAGDRLQTALLGTEVARWVADRPVVVSPTSALHAAPWGLLPVLAGVPHGVVPSGALWLRAREREAASGRAVFISGPGLTTGGAEIDEVAPRHEGAVVLRDGAATVDASLGALDGARLAHLAAHGHFRADSPLFSSLDLADGPLLVHDFERMATPPHRVVLSACDSGVLAPVGAGELLGLVAALLAVGTAGVVASVAVVNDEATVDVMVDVHAGLEAGDDLARALLRARAAASDDPVRAAAAAAFLALGV